MAIAQFLVQRHSFGATESRLAGPPSRRGFPCAPSTRICADLAGLRRRRASYSQASQSVSVASSIRDDDRGPRRYGSCGLQLRSLPIARSANRYILYLPCTGPRDLVSCSIFLRVKGRYRESVESLNEDEP